MSLATVPSAPDTPLRIHEVRSRRKEGALHELAVVAAELGYTHDGELLEGMLVRLERLRSSAVGKGVAIPYLRSLAVLKPRLLLARSPRGVDWGAADDVPVRIIVLALAPAELPSRVWHELLARAVASTRAQRNRQKLLEGGIEEAFAVLEGTAR